MRVFLSYHSRDHDIAFALKSAIERALPGTDVFVDQTHLRHGHLWQPALFDAIANAQAFLVLVSNRIGDWQKVEYYEARDRKAKDDAFILLPVVIADRSRGPAANLPGLAQLHWIESTEPTAPEPLAKIVAALQSREPPKPPEPWRAINPYRGLVALDEQDADFFFGRDRETGDIVNHMIAKPGRLIALVGNSGVGKSSLVQAGVIGALKRQRWPGGGHAWPDALKDSRAWAYLTMKPGEDPVGALVSAFIALWFPDDATDPKRVDRRNEWTERLTAGKARLSDLIEATDARFRSELSLTPPPRVFFYIDQGEELYARARPEARKRFSEVVADGLASCPQRLIVMTSQRSDYYGELQANAALFKLAEKIDVAPLDGEALQLVLREPAGVLGVRFESDDLVSRIVKRAEDQPGALPLLADLLDEMWRRMQARQPGDALLRISDHPELIEVGAALSKRADQFLARNPDKEEAVRRLFTLRLAHVPRQGEPVRARWERAEGASADDQWTLAEELAGADWRLLVTGVKDGKPTAEVAHEILLKTWSLVRGWLEAEREFLVWRGEISARREDWEKAGRIGARQQHQALLMGLALITALAWQQARPVDIDAKAHAFIDASLKASRAVERRRKWLIGALGMSMLAGLTVALPHGVHITYKEFATSPETQSWLFDRAATKAVALVGREEADTVVKVWQLAPHPLHEPIMSIGAQAAKLSPDGRYLALLKDGQLFVLSTEGMAALPPPVADLREPFFLQSDAVNAPEAPLPTGGTMPEAYFEALRFSSDSRWVIIVTPQREVLLIKSSAADDRVLITKLESVELFKGYPFIAASQKRIEFAICDGQRLLQVRPDHQPRIQERLAVAAPLAGCEYVAGENVIGVRSGNAKLALARVDNGVLGYPSEIAFPVAADQSRSESNGPGLLEYVVTPDGRSVHGRAPDGSFAGAAIAAGIQPQATELFSTPTAPRTAGAIVWSSSNSKWIAGVAEDGGFYAWPNNLESAKGDNRLIFRRGLSEQESPAISVRETTDEAMMSNGRGVLLTLNLADKSAEPRAVGRVGGRSVRVALLADDSGWQVSSTGEVKLISAAGVETPSPIIKDEIAAIARTDDGTGLWAGTDTRLIRFRRVILFWGLPIIPLEWPKTKAGTASTWGYTGNDPDRYRPSGN